VPEPPELQETAATAWWRRPLVADTALAAVVFAVLLSGAWIMGSKRSEPDLTVGGALLLLGQSAPLVLRRRWPFAVSLVTGGFAAAYGIRTLPDTIAPLGALVALATVVQLCSRRTAVLIAVISLTSALVSVSLSDDVDAQDWWFSVVVLLLAWAAGLLLRSRHERVLELEDRAARLTADRQRELAAARAAERTRLARELHDVVAHHVSMMVVQAEAGAASGGGAAAFDGIAGTGRQALAELRRLLTVLRGDDHHASTAPQPGVAEIAELVDQVRAAGLAVEYRAEGTPRPLPAGVDLSAYRVVQEGLTNVLKHAGPAHATVTVRYGADCVELRVVDDGRGDRPNGGLPGGFGLVGLRERVALFGGDLDAGPTSDGEGYALAVRLPIGS
jgi:signal transduction histidine kinase